MDEYWIECGIDWGTWKCAITYAYHQLDERITPVSPLIIDDKRIEQRSMCAWDKNGVFLHGFELERRAVGDSDLSERVINLFKLLLYKRGETSEVARRAERRLADAGKTLDQLIAAHLRALVEDAKRAILKSEEKMNFAEDEIANLLEHMRVRITVPQMWPPDARRQMMAAAKAAGLSTVVLASEPQCALSYLVDKAAQKKFKLDRQLRKGDMILVADLGSGTGDLVLYKLLEDLSQNSRLEAAGHSSGDLCGSFRVDEQLFEALIARMGKQWVHDTALKLGVSETDLTRRALDVIETVKRGFDPEVDSGIGNIRGVKSYETIELLQAEMRDAFDQVIEVIIKQIDKFVSYRKQPDIVLVTGGFSKSGYLMQKLRNKYEARGIIVVRPNDTDGAECFPVAIGSLLRYDQISTKGLPALYSFYILRREEYDEDLHSKQNAKKSPYDPGIDVVDDCMVCLISKGQRIEPGAVFSPDEVLNEYYIPVDDPHISAEFVYTTKRFQNHATARVVPKKDSGNNLPPFKSGVHPWVKMTIPIDRKDLEAHKYERVTVNDEDFWKISAKVVIRVCDEDFQTAWEVCKPQDTSRRSIKNEDGEYEAEVAFTLKDKVWERSQNEFTEEEI